jgi:hypothetical protein
MKCKLGKCEDDVVFVIVGKEKITLCKKNQVTNLSADVIQ